MNLNIGQIIKGNPVIINLIKDWARTNPKEAFEVFRTAAPDAVRDLEALAAQLQRATTEDQKNFIAANGATLIAFLESKDGQEMISMTIETWKQYVESKSAMPS